VPSTLNASFRVPLSASYTRDAEPSRRHPPLPALYPRPRTNRQARPLTALPSTSSCRTASWTLRHCPPRVAGGPRPPLDAQRVYTHNRGMLKRLRITRNANQLAADVVSKTTGIPRRRKNPAAVALGHLGGKKGGKARAEKLSPRRRRQIAKKAAEARWRSKKPNA
jgi:hypothetical protein